MLNTFFGLLADEPQEVADNFIKDRCDWFTFNRLALKAARRNPALILWIWQLAGFKDLVRWLGNYFNFGLHSLVSALLSGWFPRLLVRSQPWLETRYPALWFRLLVIKYAITFGTALGAIATGKPPSPNPSAQFNSDTIIAKSEAKILN
jgi:lycopene cyclase CruA